MSLAPYEMVMIEASTLTMFDLSYINSTMFIGFRHSWGYLFNNDPGGYLFYCFNKVTSNGKLKIRGC